MQLRSREYIDNYKISWHEIYENIRIFRFASNLKYNCLSKEKTEKIRKIKKLKTSEKLFGVKFTK